MSKEEDNFPSYHRRKELEAALSSVDKSKLVAVLQVILEAIRSGDVYYYENKSQIPRRVDGANLIVPIEEELFFTGLAVLKTIDESVYFELLFAAGTISNLRFSKPSQQRLDEEMIDYCRQMLTSSPANLLRILAAEMKSGLYVNWPAMEKIWELATEAYFIAIESGQNICQSLQPEIIYPIINRAEEEPYLDRLKASLPLLAEKCPEALVHAATAMHFSEKNDLAEYCFSLLEKPIGNEFIKADFKSELLIKSLYATKTDDERFKTYFWELLNFAQQFQEKNPLWVLSWRSQCLIQSAAKAFPDQLPLVYKVVETAFLHCDIKSMASNVHNLQRMFNEIPHATEQTANIELVLLDKLKLLEQQEPLAAAALCAQTFFHTSRSEFYAQEALLTIERIFFRLLEESPKDTTHVIRELGSAIPHETDILHPAFILLSELLEALRKNSPALLLTLEEYHWYERRPYEHPEYVSRVLFEIKIAISQNPELKKTNSPPSSFNKKKWPKTALSMILFALFFLAMLLFSIWFK